MTNPVGGNLEAVFKKRDPPANQDDREERGRFVFEMPVPGECHEDIGNRQ